MPCFVADLGCEEKHSFSEVWMDTRDPLGGNIESRVFGLCEESHQLADRAFQFFIERPQFTPWNIPGPVPVGRRRLLVKLRGSGTPGTIPIDHIKRELGAAIFHDRTARRESVDGSGSFLNLSNVAKQPVAGIEASVVDWCAVAPIELAAGQDSERGALFDAMAPAAVLNCRSQKSMRKKARPGGKIVLSRCIVRQNLYDLARFYFIQNARNQDQQAASRRQIARIDANC